MADLPLGVAVLAVLAVAGLALWLHLRFWVRRLSLPLPYAETHRVATADGSAFELRRIRSDLPATAAPPVLLVHGIAINHRNLDTTADLSLARQLAAAGRDAWLLTLRSGRADLGRVERGTVRFAAMVDHDVPQAVAEVLRRTGAPCLDYVGFSMGGMLLYAALGRTLPEASVRRVVILGSPGRVAALVPLGPLAPLASRVAGMRALAPWLPWPLPLRMLGQLAAFASEWLSTPLHAPMLNLANAAPGSTRVTLVDAVRDVPMALALDFAHWAYADGVLRVRGAPALDGLHAVAVPVLFVAGAADRLGAPGAVRLAFDAWGRDVAAAKAFVLLARKHGHAADYGHADLQTGRHAPAEVNAPAVAFLGAPDAAAWLDAVPPGREALVPGVAA